jgi:hypothetical protein
MSIYLFKISYCYKKRQHQHKKKFYFVIWDLDLVTFFNFLYSITTTMNDYNLLQI